MNETVHCAEMKHHLNRKQRFNLKIMQNRSSRHNPWWEILTLVRQLENEYSAHARLLIELAEYLDERHWTVTAVVNSIQNRLHETQLLLAHFRVDLRRKICGDELITDVVLQNRFIRFNNDAQQTVALEETLLLKMLEMLQSGSRRPNGVATGTVSAEFWCR